MLAKDEKISEGQAGFRPNRSCVDHVYTLGRIIQGRKDAGLTAHCFFLDIQAYDTVWRNGLRKKLCETGIRQRKDVEDGAENYRNIEIFFISYKELHKDVRCHPLYSTYLSMT